VNGGNSYSMINLSALIFGCVSCCLASMHAIAMLAIFQENCSLEVFFFLILQSTENEGL